MELDQFFKRKIAFQMQFDFDGLSSMLIEINVFKIILINLNIFSKYGKLNCIQVIFH